MTKPRTMKHISKPAVFASLVASGFLFRRFQLRWGAVHAEADGGLPGDHLLSYCGSAVHAGYHHQGSGE